MFSIAASGDWRLATGDWRLATGTLECSERGADFSVVRLVSRVVQNLLVTHDAGRIDHEDGALGNVLESNHVGIDNAVLADDLLVVVAEQRKAETLLVAPGLEREKGVRADAQD